jgi:hypothetical protein
MSNSSSLLWILAGLLSGLHCFQTALLIKLPCLSSCTAFKLHCLSSCHACQAALLSKLHRHQAALLSSCTALATMLVRLALRQGSGDSPWCPKSGYRFARRRHPGMARANAPFTRSVTTLSSLVIKRKSLGQRFGRISVSDQSHGRHGSRAGPGQRRNRRPVYGI